MNTPFAQALRRYVAVGLLAGLSPVCFCADTAAATEASTVASEAANLIVLRREIASLRQQLRESERARREAAGPATDTELAGRVALTEKLLLKQQLLLQAWREQRERQPNGDDAARAELQQALAAAKSDEEQAALIARHVAFQRVLAAEEAAQARQSSAAQPSPLVR